MIVPDVNVLVTAFHRDAVGHEQHAHWLRALLAGPTEVGLVDFIVVGFVRIVTHRRVFEHPAPAGVAVEFVQLLRSGPRVRDLQATSSAHERLRHLIAIDPQVRGNLIPDAWIAAVAMANGAQVATRDRGFARFDGLTLIDPASPN